MITIVSADINKGKTTWLKNNYANQQKGDGFLCIKTFKNEIHTGYDLLHLSTNRQQPFIRKINYLPEIWNEKFRIANIFSFNNEGFAFAEQIANNAIQNKLCPFYLDEIGILELEEKGFYSIFKSLLEANLDIIIAVRYFLVEEVIQKFQITNFKELKV